MRKKPLARLGDFFFRYRNFLFPLILASLFLAFPPVGSFPGPLLLPGRDLVAILLVIAGTGFRSVVIGLAYIKRGGVNKRVYADRLVTSGIFGLCRNPLYVGNLAIYAGILLLHGHPAVIVTGVSVFYSIYVSMIAAEEHYLEEKFGREYRDYCARVPRWFPDFSGYREVMEGISFSPARAVFKDYTTVFNTATAVIAIVLLKSYLYAGRQDFYQVLQYGTFLLAVLLLAVLAIKFFKKRGMAREYR